MTDKKDDYYQPWLRDPAPTPASQTHVNPAPPSESASEGLAKPRSSPPIGIDVSRYPTDESAPRKPAIDRDKVKAGAAGLWQGVRSSVGAFADWTIRIGERADVPARVEAMEIPRRSRELAGSSADLTVRGSRAVGRGAAKGGQAIAATSGRLWTKMALGDKVGKLSNDAGQGLGKVADKARTGLGKAAKASKSSLGEAATKLRPAPRAEAEPPPSGLEQLLAREAKAEGPMPPTAPDLPLFANEAASVPPAAPKAAAPLPSHKPTQAATAASPPSISSPAPDDRTPGFGAGGGGRHGPVSDRYRAKPPREWMMALLVLAMLGAAFWLGGRFGGGMSRGEVETVVADYIKTHPEIVPAAMEAHQANQVSRAIDAIRPALEKPYAGAWAGNANGDVTIVVFSDYACVFCRASVPDVDQLLREDRRVKVVFRELPIIAPQSRDAALMALAAARQGKYDAFHHAMFASTDIDSVAIAAAATKAGVVTDGSADATGNEALFQRELDSNIAMAQQLRMDGTPTWIVGDQLLQGRVGYAGLKQAVAKARTKG